MLVGAGGVGPSRADEGGNRASAAVDVHDGRSAPDTVVPGEPAHVAALLASVAEVQPARPERCRVLAAGVGFQTALDMASDGDTFCLAPGTYGGPITISRRITLWGPRDAIVASDGQGTTVRISGAGAALLGFSVIGSGSRYDKQDAGILVAADRVRIEGVMVRDAVFGITVEQARAVILRGNRIVCRRQPMLGLRGDALRLWEVYDSTVEGNVVVDGRDVVVWYSSRNRIVDNIVTGSRYGTHFMYSHQNTLAHNRYVGNVVGVFLMYSRQVELRDNLMAASGGAAGFGLGLKESSGLTVVDNVLVKNTVGIYVDSSPFVPGMPNRFEGNVIRLGETGVLFHSSPHENVFIGNSFRDNFQQVRVDGGGDALDVVWRGNDFDDYVGYDLDGDGFGDVPYELRSLSNRLIGTYPSLAFLYGTPTLALVEAISFIVPLFQPRTLLVDPAPRMAPLTVGSVP
jgi:nitrous oxidase accessory protein